LAGLLGVSSTPANARIQPAGATLAGALGAWAHLAAGDAERGYALFREHLALGFRHGTGVWPERLPAEAGSPPAGCLDHAAAAAMVPAILLFGLLGARGDAPVGRLRLAPRFPASWPSFRVAGIRLGDGEVELDYERDRDRHTFRARQPRGRVPFMLVLEPEVPARRLAKVEIDGKEAVLDHFQRGGRVGARVQLPLDRERNVTLVAAQGA
jgi:hypothetical protein